MFELTRIEDDGSLTLVSDGDGASSEVLSFLLTSAKESIEKKTVTGLTNEISLSLRKVIALTLGAQVG